MATYSDARDSALSRSTPSSRCSAASRAYRVGRERCSLRRQFGFVSTGIEEGPQQVEHVVPVFRAMRQQSAQLGLGEGLHAGIRPDERDEAPQANVGGAMEGPRPIRHRRRDLCNVGRLGQPTRGVDEPARLGSDTDRTPDDAVNPDDRTPDLRTHLLEDRLAGFGRRRRALRGQ